MKSKIIVTLISFLPCAQCKGDLPTLMTGRDGGREQMAEGQFTSPSKPFIYSSVNWDCEYPS